MHITLISLDHTGLNNPIMALALFLFSVVAQSSEELHGVVFRGRFRITTLIVA